MEGASKDSIKVLRGDKRRDAVDIYDYIDKRELSIPDLDTTVRNSKTRVKLTYFF